MKQLVDVVRTGPGLYNIGTLKLIGKLNVDLNGIGAGNDYTIKDCIFTVAVNFFPNAGKKTLYFRSGNLDLLEDFSHEV